MKDPTRFYLKMPAWVRYLLALAIFVAMLAIRVAVLPGDAEMVFLTFFPGLAITALVCGVGPGVFFLTLATSVSSYIFFPPHWDSKELSSNLPATGGFVLAALVILWVLEFFHRQAEKRNKRLVSEISRRQHFEAVSEEASAQLAAIFDSTMDAIISVDSQYRIVLFNPAAETMFGYAASEIVGSPVDRLLPEQFRDRHAGHVQQFMQGGGSIRKMGSLDDLRGLRRNGEEFPVEASVSMTRAKHPILTVILRDVSERRKTEHQLNIGRRQLGTLIDQVPVSIAMLDEQLNYITTSRCWLTEFGHGRSDLTGLNHYDVNPDIKEDWRIVYQEALKGNSARKSQDLWVRADGSRHWLRWAVHPWFDDRGMVGGIIIFTEDISHHLMTEAALKASEYDLIRAQSVGNIGSWRLNVRLNQLTWSAENYRIFGVAEGTPLSYESFLDRVHPEDRDYVDGKWQACLAGESYDIEHRLLVDGKVKWVCEKAELEFDDAGILLGGFGITQDITEKRLVENQLKDASDRLAAVAAERALHLWELSGALTHAEQMERDRIYELLHDHVQPLLVATRLGLSGLSAQTPPAQWLLAVDRAKESLSKVIQTARSLSIELSPPLIRESGLLPALESLCSQFHSNYGLTVAMSFVPEAEPASMTIRLMCFNAIRELLMNVIKHAGTLHARLDLAREAPNTLRIKIEDDGLGFEPSARHDGSGLANHVRRLGMVGGSLLVESSPGVGTCFTLRAPLEMRVMETFEPDMRNSRRASGKPSAISDKADAVTYDNGVSGVSI